MRLLCGEGLYKTWGTAKMCENKNLSYFMYLSGVGMGRVKMGGGGGGGWKGNIGLMWIYLNWFLRLTCICPPV